MKTYTYVAKDQSGQPIRSSIAAASRYEAIADLKEQGFTVISISGAVSSEEYGFEKAQPLAVKPAAKAPSRLRARVKSEELAAFCRQLSVSVNAGIPLIDSLQAISDDMDNPYFKKILQEIVADIHKGRHFSDAISKHKNIFTPILIALIRSAEESGSIMKVFDYIANYLEKGVRLQQKIRSITTYPVFVLGFFVVVMVIVTLFILPRFETMFTDLGGELPGISKFIFGVNRFVINNFALLVIAVFAAVAWFVMYSRTTAGSYRVDRMKLELPIFGALLKKLSMARLCRVLAIMIQGGVSVETALEIASKVCGNKFIEKSLELSREDIIAGSAIATSLKRSGIFPSLMLRMVAIGESSAKLPEVMNKVADMYEDQVEGSVMVMTSLFEPIMIIVFGGMILVVVLSIYVPVFKTAMVMR